MFCQQQKRQHDGDSGLDDIYEDADLFTVFVGRAVKTHHQVPTSLGVTKFATGRFGFGLRILGGSWVGGGVGCLLIACSGSRDVRLDGQILAVGGVTGCLLTVHTSRMAKGLRESRMIRQGEGVRWAEGAKIACLSSLATRLLKWCRTLI